LLDLGCLRFARSWWIYLEEEGGRGVQMFQGLGIFGTPCFLWLPRFLFYRRQLCGMRHTGSVGGTESASISRIFLVPSNSTIVSFKWQISSSYLPIKQWDQKRNFATTAEKRVLGQFYRAPISNSDVGKHWGGQARLTLDDRTWSISWATVLLSTYFISQIQPIQPIKICS